ncbi:hypothetical protein STRIP9103_08836 [Streptomyces ipomoeae 91-03]|uniref:Uncharacterized protein n=1 Tax=Streptomyces ipomoeae 91-03 TaxID=698759 RepID=L1L1U0_9ACTN|nr:hypothetical protein STRIP9103_08836 [Streptomyces ipomoeae 91-03]
MLLGSRLGIADAGEARSPSRRPLPKPVLKPVPKPVRSPAPEAIA